MKKIAWIVAVIVIFGAATLIVIDQKLTAQPGGGTQNGGAIKIVAAEDFYGNIAQQLGGDKVSVRSLISDPTVDPHEYESSVQDAIAIADANIVIENGLHYDAWMDKLIGASPSSGRIVITAGMLAPDPLPENPHVWYSIETVSATADAITNALVAIDPSDEALFRNNLLAFKNSLTAITARMDAIKARYAGTPVGLTETIYLYQTKPMGLDVLTPFDFEKAVAEGNDPSAWDVNAANRQIADKKIKVLIYNSQTVTPVTTNLENAARANDIPIVPVTETMPPDDTYQTWMADELNLLEAALEQSH